MTQEHLLDRCRESKKVICYGTGNYSMHVTAFLKCHGIHVTAYCMTKPGSSNFLGKIVIEPKDINLFGNEAICLVCMNEGLHEEIKPILVLHGVKNFEYITDDVMLSLRSCVACKEYMYICILKKL